MGLSRASVAWLIEESQRRAFEGTLLTLGVQNVFLSQSAFEALAARMGCPLGPVPGDARPALIEGTVSAEHVFRRLGFERVVTTDADPFEGCDLVFDLNAGAVPEEHLGAYDMVLDAGTLEHVFHVPNALSNLLGFTRTGGRIVHQVPSSNHIDHGFWMFSPTLFWDYYTANGVELPRFDLFRYRSSSDATSPWVFGAYRPGMLDKQMFGGLGGGCFGLAVVAEKVRDADVPVIPQQGMYARAWEEQTSPGLVTQIRAPSGARTHLNALRARVLSLLPVEWRVRWKAARRRFPLPVRRRF